jgi:hypothetical protein
VFSISAFHVRSFGSFFPLTTSEFPRVFSIPDTHPPSPRFCAQPPPPSYLVCSLGLARAGAPGDIPTTPSPRGSISGGRTLFPPLATPILGFAPFFHLSAPIKEAAPTFHLSWLQFRGPLQFSIFTTTLILGVANMLVNYFQVVHQPL